MDLNSLEQIAKNHPILTGSAFLFLISSAGLIYRNIRGEFKAKKSLEYFRDMDGLPRKDYGDPVSRGIKRSFTDAD